MFQFCLYNSYIGTMINIKQCCAKYEEMKKRSTEGIQFRPVSYKLLVNCLNMFKDTRPLICVLFLFNQGCMYMSTKSSTQSYIRGTNPTNENNITHGQLCTIYTLYRQYFSIYNYNNVWPIYFGPWINCQRILSLLQTTKSTSNRQVLFFTMSMYTWTRTQHNGRT